MILNCLKRKESVSDWNYWKFWFGFREYSLEKLEYFVKGCFEIKWEYCLGFSIHSSFQIYDTVRIFLNLSQLKKLLIETFLR